MSLSKCYAATYSRRKRQNKIGGRGEYSVPYRRLRRNYCGKTARTQQAVTPLMSGVKGLRAAIGGSPMNSGYAAALDTRPHRCIRVVKAA